MSDTLNSSTSSLLLPELDSSLTSIVFEKQQKIILSLSIGFSEANTPRHNYYTRNAHRIFSAGRSKECTPRSAQRCPPKRAPRCAPISHGPLKELYVDLRHSTIPDCYTKNRSYPCKKESEINCDEVVEKKPHHRKRHPKECQEDDNLDVICGTENCFLKKHCKVFVSVLAACLLLFVLYSLRKYIKSMQEVRQNFCEMQTQIEDMREKFEALIHKAARKKQEELGKNSKLLSCSEKEPVNEDKLFKKPEKSSAENRYGFIFNKSNKQEICKEEKPVTVPDKSKKRKSKLCETRGESQEDSRNNSTIRAIVEEALKVYMADKTGKTDYALETSGGSIASIRDTESYQNEMLSFLRMGSSCDGVSGPRAMIQPSVYPGECWSFHGSRGAAVIRLISPVFISGITVEHIPKEISPSGEITSAPKEMSIWGLNDPDDENGDCLGRIVYDRDGPPLQYFKLAVLTKAFQFVEVKIHSNHGNEQYTCVYRVRIHGTLAKIQEGRRRV